MRDKNLNPLFVIFVFSLIFGIPLIFMFGDRILGKDVAMWTGWVGVLVAIIVGFYLRSLAGKNPVAKSYYQPPFYNGNLIARFVSNPDFSGKRKIFIILLPIFLLALYFLLIPLLWR